MYDQYYVVKVVRLCINVHCMKTVLLISFFLTHRTLFFFSFMTFTAWVAVGGNLAYLVVSYIHVHVHGYCVSLSIQCS